MGNGAEMLDMITMAPVPVLYLFRPVFPGACHLIDGKGSFEPVMCMKLAWRYRLPLLYENGTFSSAGLPEQADGSSMGGALTENAFAEACAGNDQQPRKHR